MTRDTITIGESERWLSVIAGGMLALSSLRRRDLGAGLLFAVSGAALLYRGFAGHDGFVSAVKGGLGQELGGDRVARSGAGGGPGGRSDQRDRGHDPDDAADDVEEASMESFPASDPPSWTPTAGAEVDEDVDEELEEDTDRDES